MHLIRYDPFRDTPLLAPLLLQSQQEEANKISGPSTTPDFTSPYAHTSPVFVHARACTPWGSANTTTNTDEKPVGVSVENVLPDQVRRMTVSLRAYDAQCMMRRGWLGEGAQAERVAAEMLSDDGDAELGQGPVAFVFVHNAAHGCWIARVERA